MQDALIRDGVWSIVNGSEIAPTDLASDRYMYVKFSARKDCALATIVLSTNPSLLYLVGDHDDPIAVWKKLGDQFQRKMWANKLKLRKQLYSLRLKESDSAQEHMKNLTEIFNELSIIGVEISDEDRVVYLIASLPESFNTLVTALEANAEISSIEVVSERLLHEESKK